MNRTFTRALVLGLFVAVASVGVALATPGSAAVGTTLGRGTLEAGDKIKNNNLKLTVRTDIDVVTQTITIGAGGHTGWHSHPGPVFVTITAGAMTFYDGDDPTCAPVVYPTGSTFIDEGGGHVHIARNEGTTNLVLYATYLLPVGAPLRTDAPDPGNCAG
jgi:quercetin dioxygenase-like cupin family protein